MTLLSARDAADRPRRLAREDWIEAGLAVLVAEGIEAVQITRLAARLEVTRGSFYWHFADRAALLDGLLAEWRARNTGVMVAALAGAGTLADGILALFGVWVDHRRFDRDLDQAIRDWARRDEAIHRVIGEEDRARVEAIAAFFRRMGYEPVEAFIRARVIYFTQVSYYGLKVREPMSERLSYLSAYYLAFTGQELDPQVAEEHRRRFASWEDEA